MRIKIKIPSSITLIVLLSFPGYVISAEKLQIDHVIVAVHNLEIASETFRDIGFTVKQGRLHKSGLTNSHIKFLDETQLELISLVKGKSDSISTIYSNFLAEGEGGAFIALSGISLSNLSEKLENIEQEHEHRSGRLWDYIIFPKRSGLDHIFFIEYHHKKRTENRYLKHINNTTGIRNLWIEGDKRLIDLFAHLEIETCRFDPKVSKDAEYCYRLNGIDLIIVKPELSKNRFRFMGVGFDNFKKSIINNRIMKHGIFIDNSFYKTCNKNLE